MKRNILICSFLTVLISFMVSMALCKDNNIWAGNDDIEWVDDHEEKTEKDDGAPSSDLDKLLNQYRKELEDSDKEAEERKLRAEEKKALKQKSENTETTENRAAGDPDHDSETLKLQNRETQKLQKKTQNKN